MNRQAELAWAAGLFEGEGCFTGSRNHRGDSFQPRARLNMTDEDIVRRFRDVIGFGTVRPKASASTQQRWHLGSKPQWLWQVGSFAEVQAALALMWEYLGPRRRERGAEILRQARGTSGRRSNS